MRTPGLLSLTIAMFSVACAASGEPQPAKDPVQPDGPKPQTAINTPQPQAATMNDPKAQSPGFQTAGPQAAINDPSPQKPFYPPGSSGAVLAKTDKPMTDGEVLGVVLAVNDGEVQMADQAAKKGTSAEVKAFAAMMKTHHGQGVTKTKGVSTKTKIATSDSDLQSFLKTDVANTMKDLVDKTGKDFDKAYMDAQVKAHKSVLTALDNRLIPSATNADVKSLLTETRGVVTTHITKAEEIQKKLDTTSSLDEPSTSSAKAKLEMRP